MVLNINYEEEVLKILKSLDKTRKQRVLDFAKEVAKPPQGEPGASLVKRSSELNFDADSLREMEEAIEEAFNVIHEPKDINLDD